MIALIPMIVAICSLKVMLTNASSKEIKKNTKNSLLALAEESGCGYDYYIKNGEETLRNFTRSSIVKEYLKNPSDKSLQEKVQAYTEEYYNRLDDWEGIYISEWGTTVCLAHNNSACVGKQFRTDSTKQKELMDAMLSSSDGLYNIGVISSPATGEIIVSMYMAIYDDDGTPLGYAGAGEVGKGFAVVANEIKELAEQSNKSVVEIKNTITNLIQ